MEIVRFNSLIFILACYFNSLIQAYFYLPNFSQKILSSASRKDDGILPKDEVARKRMTYSKRLVDNLAKLFATMVISNRKYADPTNVLKSLVDDFGN